MSQFKNRALGGSIRRAGSETIGRDATGESLQIFARRESANGPIEVVGPVGRGLVHQVRLHVGRMAVHEEQRPAVLAMRQVALEELPVLWLGEAAHQRLLRRGTDVDGLALFERASAVVVIELMVVVIRVAEEQVVGADAPVGRAVLFHPSDVPGGRFVAWAKVERSVVGADVRVEQLEQVDERHLRPGAPGERIAVLVVACVHRHGDAELPEVRDAACGDRQGLAPSERGQEHPSQDRDDGDDHQELDQRERAATREPGREHC